MLNVITGALDIPTPPVTNSYESIQTVTVGSGGAASISFTSIVGTYKHLQIRALSKTGSSGAPYTVQVRLNGDTGSNYAAHRLIGNGSTVTATATTSAGQGSSYYEPTTSESNVFAGAIIDILDYTNTNKNTTIRTLGGYDANGSGYVTFFSSLWLNTAAVTSITLFSEGGANLAQYSSFALYGIKG